jgi:hypothetical protein
MRRELSRHLLLLALCSFVLIGAECDENGPIPPARDFGVVLHDPGPYQHSYRSQPGPTRRWNGRNLAYVEMTAPITASGEVQPQDGTTPGGVCVFLDGAGELGDLSGTVDSQGLFTQTIVPSTYDIAVAPDCFTGSRPALYLEQVVLDGSDTDPWLLPTRETVLGQVVDAAQNPIPSAVVTVYEAGRPDRPLGVTVQSDSLGNFSFDVPQGVYDVVVSTPADGSVAIAPIRIDSQPLPLPGPPGLLMKVQYPVLPTAQVLGSLTQFGGAATTGRVRIEGWVPAEAPGSSKLPSLQFTGGAFRAEFETDADGRWGLELPRGSYRATAFPRHGNRSFGIATREFDVVVDSDLVEVDLVLPDTTFAQVTVQQNDGNPMVGAELAIRMTSPPYYAYMESTDTEGQWFGQLIPDLYEIEVIPPNLASMGPDQQFARAHGSLDLLSPEPPSLTLQLRRSDLVDGFLYSVGQTGVRGVHVLLTDPETGEIWDETVTNDGEFPGFFRATLPR